jgi:CubicO group peptidase (beta-lactamase class C family)
MDIPQHLDAALSSSIIIRSLLQMLRPRGFPNAAADLADSFAYVASISKQFSAMAIMVLAAQGKLSFDKRLPANFPRFPSSGAEITLHMFTLRHMLHDTSGLSEYFHLFSTDERISEFTPRH